MKQFLKLSIVLVMTSLSAACGFTPLYGGGTDSVRGDLSGISITMKNNRSHQLMRGHLMRMMQAGDNPTYDLSFDISETTKGFGIRQDASASQEKLTVTVKASLKSFEDGQEVLWSKTISRSVSYDLVQSDFATLTQREDSSKRLIRAIAEEIHRDLGVYFYQTRNKAAQ